MKNMLIAILLFIISMIKAQTYPSEYITNITFPAGYAKGDYIEFAQASTMYANASGYFEISIVYGRGYLVAASTHLVSTSHSNPDIWREAGVVNANDYTSANQRNFTIDVNSNTNKFRVRAINTYGTPGESQGIFIKIRPINFVTSFTSLSTTITGNDTNVTKFQPMTNEWNLYVGNPFSTDGAKIGMKVNGDGNVGIGTNPQNNYKLGVNGAIHAKEVNIDLQGWADYVFEEGYRFPTLEEVEKYIQEKGHLPNIPSVKEVLEQGINIGDSQRLLLQKIEELTLYSIEQNKQIKKLENKNKDLEKQLKKIKSLEEELQEIKSILRNKN
jgi:hypothetical protein